jgi:GTP-binding nuclear protein Ran
MVHLDLTLFLIFHVCSNQNLEFVATPALAPPEVQVDPSLIKAYEQEMAEAANMPLPEEDDADL